MATDLRFAPYLWLRKRKDGGDRWYVVYPERAGPLKKHHATPFKGAENRKKAEQYLKDFTARLKAKRLVDGDVDTGPMTVARWAKKWLETREAKGISSVDNYRSKLENHVLPVIGDVRLDEVSLEHIEKVMAAAAVREKDLAPRTQGHVYATMHAMFAKAVPKYIATNPCSIDRDDKPKKIDKNPEWRDTAVFEKEEVQKLLTAPEIPLDRRVFYAVEFLAGMRFGEIAALKVRHYKPEMKPLGQLQAAHSYSSTRRRLKGVKTDRPRVVPVHPWLARILDEWLAVGWRDMMGREPGPDDVLIPTRQGGHRNARTMWRQFNGAKMKKRSSRAREGAKQVTCRKCSKPGHSARWCGRDVGARVEPGDLGRLGLRRRRQHDARRTFISKTLDDGANKDVLRWVTHGPEGDIVDIYTSLGWATLCKAVACLQIGPPPPPLVAVRDKPAESLAAGVAKVAVKVAAPEIPSNIRYLESDPTGNRNPAQGLDNLGQGRSGGDGPSDHAGETSTADAAPAVDAGHQRSPATLATLALRQALAALERGRMDLAMDILRRAVAAEVAAGAGRAGEVG